jgi:hypothetical protein
LVQFPIGRRTIITVLDDEIVANEIINKKDTLENIFAEAEKTESNLTGENGRNLKIYAL